MTSAPGRGHPIVEWLLVIAAFVIGVPAAAWLGQERLIFFPQPAAGTAHLPARALPLEQVAADGTRLSGFIVPGSTLPAPTLLYFLGLPVARDMDGFARTDLFTQAFNAQRTITFIPTYGGQ